MKRILIVLYMGLALLCTTSTANAQGPTEKGVLGWFELNTFHPTSNPNDGFFLERGRVLKSLQPAAGAVFQIDDDPLTWQREKDGTYNETAKEIDQLIVLHLNAALGFFDYAQLGVQFPLYLDRGTNSGRSGGIGDLRIVPKLAYRFEAGSTDMGLAVVVPVGLPLGDEIQFTGQGQTTVEPRLAVDWYFGRFRLVVNAGALIVDEQSDYGYTRGPEAILGVGGELNMYEDSDAFRLISEIQFSTQMKDFFGRSSTPADMLLGLLYAFDSGFSLKGAMGTALSAGVGAPDFRMIIGLGFVPPVEFEETPEVDDKPNFKEELAEVDGDGDGIVNMNDFCPEEAEDFDTYDDEDGCLDEDNDEDGILDVDDECPLAQENINGIQDEDGCPEDDTDEDGIPNPKDKCPKQPEDMDTFEDQDGCPDTDNDKDSILDKDDKCPSLPESRRDNAVKDGCPDSFHVEEDKLTFSEKIRFVRRKAEFTRSGMDVIEDLASAINASPEWKEIHIAVHTNGRGKAKRNQRLSEDRAMAIIKALAGLEVNPERLVAEGLGDTETLESPKTREGRNTNERVEIKIVKEGVK